MFIELAVMEFNKYINNQSTAGSALLTAFMKLQTLFNVFYFIANTAELLPCKSLYQYTCKTFTWEVLGLSCGQIIVLEWFTSDSCCTLVFFNVVQDTVLKLKTVHYETSQKFSLQLVGKFGKFS